MLPAERRQVWQQRVIDGMPIAAQRMRRPLQINRVLQNDSRRYRGKDLVFGRRNQSCEHTENADRAMVHSLLFTFKRALRRIAMPVIAESTCLVSPAPSGVHLAVMLIRDTGVAP